MNTSKLDGLGLCTNGFKSLALNQKNLFWIQAVGCLLFCALNQIHFSMNLFSFLCNGDNSISPDVVKIK